jgi:hypothetical protein
MKTAEKRISVTRGRDGSIKIDPDTLYKSSEVLRQLEAGRKIAIQKKLIAPPKKKSA